MLRFRLLFNYENQLSTKQILPINKWGVEKKRLPIQEVLLEGIDEETNKGLQKEVFNDLVCKISGRSRSFFHNWETLTSELEILS